MGAVDPSSGRGPGRTRVRGADEGVPGEGVVVGRGRRAGGLGGGLLLDRVGFDPEVKQPAEYPFTLPVVTALARAGGLEFTAAVTFLVGPNGSGKSTLVEAVATAWGFNPEGGSTSFQFSTTDTATHSRLGESLVLRRGTRRARGGYFLRAESFYNVASEIDRLDAEPAPPSAGKLIDGYGGVSLHQRSHGESFLDLLTHRFRPQCLYLLDEPEAALSPHGVVTALTRIHHLAARGAQFLIATHSPILLAVPDATILQITDHGHLEHVDYDHAMPVAVTRRFLTDPTGYLQPLLEPDDPAS